MMRLQEWIHKFEVGEGVQAVRCLLAVLGLVALAAIYDWRAYKNFSTPEAMDAAQLARNLSEGKGFTTDFVRPFSMYLLEHYAVASGKRNADRAMLKGAHPDLANPPLYPLALAGLMKALPFDYGISARPNSNSWRYQPEMLIALFNQVLFFVALLMIFRLARRLFDDSVGWISVIVIAGSDLIWRFSVSGLSTMLLLVIFLGLVWCLVAMEQAAREGSKNARWLLAMALLSGIVAGLGALTRYSFAWLMVPTLLFLVAYFPGRRASLSMVALAGFLIGLTPWLVRNYQLSGAPFGTVGYAVIEETARFPEDRLERSLKPDLSEVTAGDCFRKLMTGLRTIVRNDLPKLGGNWISAFFLVGLLVPFVRPGLRRLRVFLLICLGLLSCIQALGRTHMAAEVSEVNNDNLLVVFAPLVFVYGVGMYSLLLNQLDLPFVQLRRVITGVIVIITSAPLIFSLLPPKTYPVAYPPYYPPLVQRFAVWMKAGELVMSDMPWAVAWYARQQSVWITLSVQDAKTGDDFYAINDLNKPVKGLYLTHLTLDQRFFSQMLFPQGNGWGRFVIEAVVSTNLPPGFPLKQAPSGYLQNGQLFLTDWQRWKSRTE